MPTLNKNNIRLRVIGDTEMLPAGALKELNEALEETAGNNGMQLIMALSYSSRWEMHHAINKIADDVRSGKLKGTIDADIFNAYLQTRDFPDPELLIRTSGEFRISNFLLYQIAYSELYFTHTLWPDFRKEHLYEAIVNYQGRERRFGKTGAQVQSEKQPGEDG